MSTLDDCRRIVALLEEATNLAERLSDVGGDSVELRLCGSVRAAHNRAREWLKFLENRVAKGGAGD